eukprot:7133425-Karenia_brevis.AAC.1
MRTRNEPEDISFLKAAFPGQKECAIIDIFKLYPNMGGKSIFENSSSFTNGETAELLKNMIDTCELNAC